jgi:hypothetical protein
MNLWDYSNWVDYVKDIKFISFGVH